MLYFSMSASFEFAIHWLTAIPFATGPRLLTILSKALSDILPLISRCVAMSVRPKAALMAAPSISAILRSISSFTMLSGRSDFVHFPGSPLPPIRTPCACSKSSLSICVRETPVDTSEPRGGSLRTACTALISDSRSRRATSIPRTPLTMEYPIGDQTQSFTSCCVTGIFACQSKAVSS